MNWVPSIAFVLSAALHAGLFFLFAWQSDFLSLDGGKGRDTFTVVVPISIVNSDLLGLDERNEQASQAAVPANPSHREPREPEKRSAALPAGEETTPLAAQASQASLDTRPVEQVERTAEDGSPQSPVAPQALPQPAAEARQEREQASHALEARRQQLSSLYQRDIFTALRHNRVDPRSGRTGRVVVLAVIASSGKLSSRTVAESSGSDVLDRAALATFDKSAPFPAIPHELGSDQITLRVPFEYSTR
jgi:periplasmic protein TonB